MAAKKTYNNESISSLKGADRVRKRPGVIFGSDGLEGCEHAVFEILSNAIDEAREGHGELITVTRFAGPLHPGGGPWAGAARWTGTRRRAATTGSWCSASCTPAANMTTTTATTMSIPWVSTAWAPAPPSTPADYMDVTVWRDGMEYSLHFERGEIVGEMQTSPLPDSQKRKTGTRIRWLPDLDVFTDISIPADYYRDVMKRQAVVNAGVTFRLRNQNGAAALTTDGFPL